MEKKGDVVNRTRWSKPVMRWTARGGGKTGANRHAGCPSSRTGCGRAGGCARVRNNIPYPGYRIALALYIYIGNNWVLRWVAAHGCMIVWSSCGYTAPRSNLSKAAQSFYVLNAVFTFFNSPLQLGIGSRAAEHWLGDASGSQNCACKRKHALCDTVRASPPLCSSKQVQILFLKTL